MEKVDFIIPAFGEKVKGGLHKEGLRQIATAVQFLPKSFPM